MQHLGPHLSLRGSSASWTLQYSFRHPQLLVRIWRKRLQERGAEKYGLGDNNCIHLPQHFHQMPFTKIVVPEIGSPCLNFDILQSPFKCRFADSYLPMPYAQVPKSRSLKPWHMTLFLPYLEARAFRVEFELLLPSAVLPLDW